MTVKRGIASHPKHPPVTLIFSEHTPGKVLVSTRGGNFMTDGVDWPTVADAVAYIEGGGWKVALSK